MTHCETLKSLTCQVIGLEGAKGRKKKKKKRTEVNCLKARSVSLKSNRRQMCLEEAESRSGNPALADGSSTQRRERTSDTPPMFHWGNSCVILQLKPSVYMLGGDTKIFGSGPVNSLS